jgi:hypothetical protein
LLRALGLGEVGGDAAHRVGFTGVVAQQKLDHDIGPLALNRRGRDLVKLKGHAGFDHLPVGPAHHLSELGRMNVEVGFAPDLIALHLKAAFAFAVNQDVTSKFYLLRAVSRGSHDSDITC